MGRSTRALLAGGLATLTLAGPATAATTSGAVITNGTVQLGVNAHGDLNYDCQVAADAVCPTTSAGGADVVGLRYAPLNLESTAPGCLCEGWGIADAGSGLTGSANEDDGNVNLRLDSFSAPAADRAISTVTISDAAVPGYQLHVQQDYHPSPLSPNLYADTVTITNTGSSAVTDLRYRRVMDWDIDPTAFFEWSTIAGNSPQLLFSSDDGFASADPLATKSYIDSDSVCGAAYTGPCTFIDLGSGGTYPTVTSPDDHGGLFDFGFGALAAGASKTFTVYYGAAPSETAAKTALAAGGAQVYSLGESSCGGDTIATCGDAGSAGVEQGKPATFMFGFVTTTGDLSITKTDSPDPVQAGQNLTYSITVNNNGPEQATGVQVEDALPPGLMLISATPTQGSCLGTTTIECNLGTIANNGSAHVSIVVTPSSAGVLTNTATVTSASSDANQANNSATATTAVNPAQPSLSIGDTTVPEGDAGTTNATFTVILSQAAASDVTVHWATSDGTATASADYNAGGGDLTFAPGQTSRTFSVPVVGDTVIEPDETFGVTLSSPGNATLATAAATGTIVDDDSVPAAVVPVISVGGATVDPEGDTGTRPATFTVSLSAPTTATVVVGYTTADVTATTPADYARDSGVVSFPPGQTSRTVTVDVDGDTLVEGNEVFRLHLFSPVAGTLGTAQGTGTIVDDDKPPVVKPPGGVSGDGVFCGTQHRGACRGLQFTAQFQNAPGNASWTFDAYNPSPGKSGKTRAHSAAITYVRVGALKKAITSKAPVKVTFKVKGKKANTILKTIKRKKLTRLRITTTFVSAAGKRTKTVNVVKLR